MYDDLTVIYNSASKIPTGFRDNVLYYLLKAIGNTKIISVTKKSLNLGVNIVTPGPSSYMGIYRDMLVGVKMATTKYIAIAEDDTFYSPEHFKYRPKKGVYAYNVGCWGLFTWSDPPIYSWRGRRNNSGLICERDDFIDAMEERFTAFPDESKINLGRWAEIGKYESKLGLPERVSERFYTNPANIMVFHEDGSSMLELGKKKRLGELRAWDIPFWGKAANMVNLCK